MRTLYNRGGQGRRKKGCPAAIGDPGLGQEKDMYKRPSLSDGQRQAAAMALRAACNG